MISPPTDKNAALKTMQIIAGALTAGVLVFGAIVAPLALGNQADTEPTSFVATLAAGFSVLALVVCAIVPLNVSGAPAGGSSDPGRELALYAGYQTRMIVRFAILEGAAMANLAAALVDRQVYSLAVAGVIVLIMLVMFPTRGRVQRFVKSQIELSNLPHGNEGP
jgi:hypothetical protein